MGKGGFRTTKKAPVVQEVKTCGVDALKLCGFLKFGTDLPRAPSFVVSPSCDVKEGKGKEKEEAQEEQREKEKEKKAEEALLMEQQMLEREWEERRRQTILWEEMSAWEEHCRLEREFPADLEEDCAVWEWKMFGKKWQRKGPALRERRPSRSLKKEKVNPKRYTRSRCTQTDPKFTFQPRSIENYLPSRSKKQPTIQYVAPVVSHVPKRPYVPYTRPSAPLGSWEPIPDSILPPPRRFGSHQAARNHQANRSNLDGDLQKALESSVVAAPSGKKYTPEQAARMLIEMQNREITPDDFALLSILDDCLQKKTVEEGSLEKLPVGLWKDLKDSPGRPSSSESREETCRICLLEYEEADELCTLPCAHLFHKDCIREWLSNSSTACPLDGQEVVVKA